MIKQENINENIKENLCYIYVCIIELPIFYTYVFLIFHKIKYFLT